AHPKMDARNWLDRIHPVKLRRATGRGGIAKLPWWHGYSYNDGRSNSAGQVRRSAMPYPFRRILSPIDFDDNSLAALDVAAQITRDNDGMVLLLHVVPMIVAPTGMPNYVDIYKGQEEAALEKLKEIATKRLRAVKHELLTHMGDPAGSILRAARHHAADLIVMATR